jgi:hypothetical protein
MYKLRDAITFIRPGAEFNIEDNKKVIWLDNKQVEPTQEEIDEAYLLLEANDLSVKQKRQAALAKLEALGLTSDDLKALGL